MNPTIHQIWLGTAVPPWEWMLTWGDKHRGLGWSYQLFGSGGRGGWTFHNERLFNHCVANGMFNAAADVARIEILYKHGGIYIDADTECLKPLDSGLAQLDFFAVEEPSIAHEYVVSNAFMGARPGAEILRQCIDALSRLNPLDVRPDNCVELTGPGFLTRLLSKSRANAVILPPHVFDQTMDGKPVFGRPTTGPYATPYLRHHYSTTHATWLVGRPVELASKGYPGAPEPSFVGKRSVQTTIRPCDHKFIDSKSCVKCGWTP